MKQKLISHITPTISLFADGHQFVLVVRENKAQSIRNGHHMYFGTLSQVFDEVFDQKLRTALADDKSKTIKEIVEIVRDTKKEINDLIGAFECLEDKKLPS